MKKSDNQSAEVNGSDKGDRRENIRKMFGSVAHRYDLLNHLLSFGADIYWRRQAVRMINFRLNRRVVDLATGTGDMALLAAGNGATRIIGIDNSEQMLSRAAEKFRRKELGDLFYPVCSDAEHLALRSESVDAVLCAFGIRNMNDIPRVLEEIHRVLSSSGIVLILEFSRPGFFLFRALFRIYFKRILPRIGAWISGNPEAYRYLPESVDQFMSRQEFSALLKEKHFSDVRSYTMTGGIVSVYAGIKL